ncbi:hypothetical protein ACQKTA_12035 (plasmid) [Enterococcus sp. 22-H-5-01]|uniref:hypothetical protein n=1 Tax=Enterococcus sp. 22-H-5-01 TaxID=3418555 RepID=UPI003D05A3A8
MTVKGKIVETLNNKKHVVFRFERGNNFHADTLIDEMSGDKNWIHVGRTGTEHSRLINLTMCQRIVIEN